MAFGDTDLQRLLGDAFSVPVEYAGTTYRGVLDLEDRGGTDGGGFVTSEQVTMLRASYADLGAVPRDAEITVTVDDEATVYKVRETARSAPDGREVLLTLVPV